MTDERVKNVKKLFVKNRRVSVRHIASEMSFSVESVDIILHDRLNFFTGSARWVPRLLTSEQKIMR